MRKKFPFYRQHDKMDCGPTCLRMITSFYGKNYSLESLREKAYLTREGVSLLGISEAAEKIGFRTFGAALDFKELQKAPLPCIVHWNQAHFIVVYRISSASGQESIWVADPASGKIRYTRKEFCSCWANTVNDGENTGMALFLDPLPEFYNNQKETVKRKSNSFLFSYLKPYQQLILQLIFGLVLGSALQLLLPFLTQAIVDFGINDHNLNFVYLVLIGQLFLTLGTTLIGFIRGWILLHIGARVNISLISDFLAKLMRLPMDYFDTKMTGDILQRVSDHSRIQSFLTSSSLSTLFSFFHLIIFGTVLLIYSPLIFSIFFAGTVGYMGYIWLFMNKRAQLDQKRFAQQSANQGSIVQLINGMQEIKLSTCEQQKRWEWEAIQVRLFRLSIKGLTLKQYQSSGGMLINNGKNLLITALAAQLVIEGNITLGAMLSIQYIIGQLNGPVDQLIDFIREIQDAQLSLQRLNEINNKPDEVDKDKKLIHIIPVSRPIIIRNLCFRYNPLDKNPTLNHISMVIPPGKQTAIVGMSGSGKTTLIKMLLGFYPPEKGNILLGGTQLENYNIREWRKCCGVVMQDGFIFSDTIAGNIAPGISDIDKEKLKHAAEVANIHSFIEQLPLKYNTRIGTEGHGLSQGQKQRILIARAVYKNPGVIFFDEATNALDANNERIIMNNLRSFFKERTSVVVAHRLSTVKKADQIIVLEQGLIAEIGNHNELTARKGIYYHLVKNQLEL